MESISSLPAAFSRFQADHHGSRFAPTRLAGAITGLLAGLAIAGPAVATLGGRFATVEADRAHMSATIASQAMATHAVHTLASANEGVVKEFALADGTVFAVTWRGPARPDLRQLLGPSFETLQASPAVRTRRHVRAPLVSQSSDLVVRSEGRPGAFWGVAYLPKLVPAGFTANDLH